jgi:hypothetical protein
MKIKSVGNKIIARIEIIAGVILMAMGLAIMYNPLVENLSLHVISFLVRRPPNLQWSGKIHLLGEGILVIGAVAIGLFILPYWDRLKQNKTALPLAQKWDRLKQNKVVQIIAPLGAVIFIWMMITVQEFSFSFMGNEADYLPSVKQAVDHAWLPNDWYLNLNISYRQVFDFIFGQLVSKLGFVNGAYLGRLIVYLLVAIAIYIFFRTLHLHPLLGILVLLLFLNHQSLAAGEWVVGGLETKTIAYAMVILSFAFFLRKRYFTGFALAGAALSFHVLVGGYALFCILVASLLNESWRSDWRLYIKNFWPLLITGIFGFWAVIEQLLPQGGIDLNKAWNIYVYYRVPQHVMPFTWNSVPWKPELALATGLFLILYFLSNSKATRFVAAIALGSVFLFLIGLGIFAIRDTPLLRFYWFRFPDVMVPFLGAVLIALFLNDYADRRNSINSLFQRIQRGLQTTLRLLPPVIIVFLIVMLAQQTYRLETSYKDSLYNEPGTILPVFTWISENTPQQAIFLVDPTESYFYIEAQRAMLVSFKHSPQSAAAILEWYKRIKLCNGNVDLEKGNSDLSIEDLHTAFYKLDGTQIQQIANLYEINYYVGLADQKLPFERVYSDSNYAVYKIK